jgi:hypothetical protein
MARGAKLLDDGRPDPTAGPGNKAADMGMAVFHIGFNRWLDGPEGREFVDAVHEGFDQLKALASGG